VDDAFAVAALLRSGLPVAAVASVGATRARDGRPETTVFSESLADIGAATSGSF